MNKKFKCWFIVFILLLMQIPVVLGKYSGGEGSSANPWKISNKADIFTLSSDTEDYNDFFVMTDDINLAGEIYTDSLIAKDRPSPIVGYDGISFKGIFDGNDHKIVGLRIDGLGTYLALFGCVENGQIKNLGLEKCSINESFYVAGLVAYNKNGVISNCYSTGHIDGEYSCKGGLVAYNEGDILNCYSTCSISGWRCIGGLVAINDGGTITNCYANGNCFSSNPYTQLSYIGGLVGQNSGGTISFCYSSGNIEGENIAGSFVGSNEGNISNCYSIGNVNGEDFIGGFVGDNYGSISNCYSISDINSNGEYCGGMVSYNKSSNISNCFWNIEMQSHGVTESVGYNETGIITNVAGLTTEQMQKKITYITSPAGWDFVNIWGIGEKQTYPYLRQYPASDINQDSKVDYLDLAELANNWLKIN